MRKIRRGNDIDIVVRLKNDQGEVLDPTLNRGYDVFLTQLSERIRIEDYELFPDGRIGFRFRAGDQRRTGVYSITISAETSDGRVFTTDVCNAFALVRCSCDAEDGSSDAEIEALEVDATFEITAWGGGGGTVQTSLNYYDDGTGEVVPVKHPDLSTQPSILPYKFAGNYVYEQMVWLNSSDIAVGMKKVDIPEGIRPESLMVIDITGCAQSSQGCETADVGAGATAEGLFIGVVSAISDVKGIWAKIQYCVSPNIGNNYYYYQSYIQEEDYIRFFNNLRYAFIVQLSYKKSNETFSSAYTLQSGGELMLKGSTLDDFKNNKMYITFENAETGSPYNVLLSDGYRKTIWYSRQPLFYSLSSIHGALELAKLFDNVERCTITLEQK